MRRPEPIEKRWIVNVGSIAGTHARGELVTPEEFPDPGQWQRLVDIEAVRLETADEAEARVGGATPEPGA